MGNRSGGEEKYSKIYSNDDDYDYYNDYDDKLYTPKEVTPNDEIPDFGIKEMLENEEKTPKDMPDLETEQSAAERRKHKGHGFKILTPQQMLSRLPIS